MDPNTLTDTILDALKTHSTVILEAYPGYGKTKIAAKLLARAERGLVAVRTHNEIREVFKFLPDRKGVMYAYGKPKLCIKLRKFTYKACRVMNVFGRCPLNYTAEDVAWLAGTFREQDEIREYEKKRNVCLYKALRMLAGKAKKLVATYDYIVSNPQVTEGKDVLILDEAHTLLDYVDDAVIEVNTTFIEYLAKELRQSPETRALAYGLRSAYRKSTSITAFIERVDALLRNAPDTEATKTLEVMVDTYFRGWFYVQGSTFYFLTGTLPSIAKAGRKVLMGAYLPPFFFYNGKDCMKIRIEGEPRVKAYLDASITTRYEQRDEGLYKELAKKVASLVRENCGNLVVFPSHKLLENVMEHLPKELKARVVTERVDALQNGEVLVDVAGGKLSEGVNIANLSNVIVAGMPYPEPSPTLNLLSKVYGFNNVYTYLALLRTFQAVGRIRGEGTAYLLDTRYRKHTNMFPKWVEVVCDV